MIRAIALALCELLGCSTPRASRRIWQPTPGTSWQWQLSGPIDTSVAVAMYDVDLFDAPDAALRTLSRRGVKIVCYFSAGSHEPDRPDVAGIPSNVVGKRLEGWPDERWFDIRSPEVRSLVRGRLDRAVARGCDAVEPDNVDGYSNDSGFPLVGADQLAFNRFIASEAHARGLSVGLKNDLEQVPDLVGDFDWALNEECAQFSECDRLAPFVHANKAVFHVEYGDETTATEVCPAATTRNFDTLIKRLELDAFRIACR